MKSSDQELLQRAANTIRVISAEAVERANSGHPGMPMGAADYAAILWLKYLRFSASDPHWANRDRFVLSNGHGSMLLYSLLYLSGFDLTLDDLKSFRQWESRTPGHPEYHMTPGVEATTGPLGQGISNAVGMAIAEKKLAAALNTPEHSIINHRVYVFVGDGCLMEGISSEASSIAGHLGLDNLIALWDDNHISIAGSTELAFTEEVTKRYESYGWNVVSLDGHDLQAIDRVLASIEDGSGRPTLIALRTKIGKGSPNKADGHDVHGSPLGKEELALTKQSLGWPLDQEFFVPEEVAELFRSRQRELSAQVDLWRGTFESWSAANPEKRELFELLSQRAVPVNLRETLLEAAPKDGKAISTRKLSGDLLQILSREVPSLLGGSADLEPSTLTLIKGSTDIQRGEFAGKNLRFGVREHAMGAIMNGLSYYGSYLPYGSTFLCFSDYMRPTIRLAALSQIPGLFIFTHDSVFLGEDGPTHQPVEHLASLRMIPNTWVFRPADSVEVAVCYAVAAARRDGPCVFAFTRQNLEAIERSSDFSPDAIERGAYTVFENVSASQGSGTPEIVFIATGSEVAVSIAAAKQLSVSVRVVSVPCYEIFVQQGDAYRSELIPASAKKVTVEAGVTRGWSEMVGGSSNDTINIGLNHFGASAPMKVLAEKFGFTADAIATQVRSRFGIK